MSDLLGALNVKQKEAVTFGGRFLLVLAGAGSGKTKTLIARIAYEIQNGTEPESIIAVTFTNKAAKEVKERLWQVLGPKARLILVGTFHRISNIYLRRYGEWVGVSPQFQIVTPSDQKKIFRHIFEAIGLPEHGSYQQKNALTVLSEYYKHGQWPQDPLWQRAIEHYLKQTERDNCLDFDGLIAKALALYARPEFQENVVSRISHILVDEFQDTNPAQLRWIQLFLTNNAKATLVGDDDQSIYGFRGADVSIIQKASLRLDGLWTIKLEQNYRSTPAILNLANACIAVNKNRLGKELWTANPDCHMPKVITCFNEYQEAQEVCRHIHKLLHTGVPYKDIAVLYRSNALSRLIEGEARKYQWPYKISGGLPFFEREEIRDLMSYMQLVDNPHQSNALIRVINKPARKIGPKTQDAIMSYSNTYQVSYWDALLATLPTFSAGVQRALNDFLLLIQDLRAIAAISSLSDLADSIVAHTKLLQSYEKSEQSEQKADNIYQFYLALKDYEKQYQGEKERILSSFLTDYLLDDSMDTSESSDCLVFSTCHAAKGLEWPYVFIIGAENHYFPHAQSESDADVEEERRLFYVAITRAKNQVCFFHVKQRQHYQNQLYPKLSPFLQEIPSHLIDWGSFDKKESQQSFSQHTISPKNALSTTRLTYGYLSHPLFGKGSVLEIDQVNDTIKVHFDTLGTKVFRYSLCKGMIVS